MRGRAERRRWGARIMPRGSGARRWAATELEGLVQQFSRAAGGPCPLPLLPRLQRRDTAAEGYGMALRWVSSRMAHLVDFAGRRSVHTPPRHAHARQHENQVPLFLLRKILERQCASADEATGLLAWMVTGLMKDKLQAHLLDGGGRCQQQLPRRWLRHRGAGRGWQGRGGAAEAGRRRL